MTSSKTSNSFHLQQRHFPIAGQLLECIFPRGNFPNVQFPKQQLPMSVLPTALSPQPVLVAVLGPIDHPSRSARQMIAHSAIFLRKNVAQRNSTSTNVRW